MLADKSAMKEMMNGDEWWAVASLVAGRRSWRQYGLVIGQMPMYVHAVFD